MQAQETENVGESAPPPRSDQPRLMRDPFDVSWRERLVVLGSLAGIIALTIALGFAYAPDLALELAGLIPASVFAMGKFLPLWGITGQSQFSPWELGLVIWVLDTITVIILVYALEALYQLRPFKRMLHRVQTNAGLVLTAYPRIRRVAVVGVVLFVLFPVAGTGALGGSFLGILLGLNRVILIIAISGGGLLGGMTMAFAAVYFGEALQYFRTMQSHPLVRWSLIAAVIISVVLLFWWFNRIYKRALAAAQEQSRATYGPNDEPNDESD